MNPVEFSPAARAELDAAADRYERGHPGRGLRFYAAVERAVKLIARFPSAGPPFPHTRTELQVRRCIVRGFPFALAYRVLGETIFIDAVAHLHRRPGHWHQRVR